LFPYSIPALKINLHSTISTAQHLTMNFSVSLLQLLGLASTVPNLATAQSGMNIGMNITAISTVNGASVLECWSLAAPPKNFAGAANYPIGDFQSAFVGVIPPKTYIGFAHAPSVQYVLFSSFLNLHPYNETNFPLIPLKILHSNIRSRSHSHPELDIARLPIRSLGAGWEIWFPHRRGYSRGV
jgi:hypothetical protein